MANITMWHKKSPRVTLMLWMLIKRLPHIPRPKRLSSARRTLQKYEKMLKQPMLDFVNNLIFGLYRKCTLYQDG